MASSNEKNKRLVIVTGMSGAGKSVVLNTLEDLDYYCIDNLPVSLLDHLSSLVIGGKDGLPAQMAVGIDARNPAASLSSLPESIAQFKKEGIDTELVYMEAGDDVLTKRYSETRRKHPLSSAEVSLTEAIAKERIILSELSDFADLRIDTSHTVVHGLRDIVRARIAQRTSAELSILFLSFGFKHGVPRESDYVFDVRCLPNPHWDNNLRRYTGKDQPVIDFLSMQPMVKDMEKQLKEFLEYWIPKFEEENRSYLCVAIGCTGGHHRSVFLVEQLAAHFIELKKNVLINHRDL
ncbi:MAG: RNase adapter RapZ [Gammaproteobacteria bacterium]|jgi:RNase adapter protein RapZ|nr:RNase adapter RapZ [Gammaproteobacteria bacterium]